MYIYHKSFLSQKLWKIFKKFLKQYVKGLKKVDYNFFVIFKAALYLIYFKKTCLGFQKNPALTLTGEVTPRAILSEGNAADGAEKVGCSNRSCVFLPFLPCWRVNQY